MAEDSYAKYPGAPEQSGMPARLPTGSGLPPVRAMKPFYVQCKCTVCDTYTLVDGAGEFYCPNQCGCYVVVK